MPDKYSVIKWISEFYFDYNDSHLFNVLDYRSSYIQLVMDGETVEINFSTENQYMVITRENGRLDTYCHDSDFTEKHSESIDIIAKIIFGNFSDISSKGITMDGMKLKLIEMFNLAESTVPTFEELDQ
jgi:hypothetical protein